MGSKNRACSRRTSRIVRCVLTSSQFDPPWRHKNNTACASSFRKVVPVMIALLY